MKVLTFKQTLHGLLTIIMFIYLCSFWLENSNMIILLCELDILAHLSQVQRVYMYMYITFVNVHTLI